MILYLTTKVCGGFENEQRPSNSCVFGVSGFRRKCETGNRPDFGGFGISYFVSHTTIVWHKVMLGRSFVAKLVPIRLGNAHKLRKESWMGVQRCNLSVITQEPIPNSRYIKHFFTMPDVFDGKDGRIKKWNKQVGEEFQTGDTICVISFSIASIEYSAESSGILTEHLAKEEIPVAMNKPFASYVLSKEAYMSFIDSKHDALKDAEHLAEANEVIAAKNSEPKKPDTMLVMKEIKHLIQSGMIEDGGDFAKKLQSLVRKGDKDIMDAFQASFDGTVFSRESFDSKFFLSNAQEIVKEKMAA
eukprot:gene24857-30034_t